MRPELKKHSKAMDAAELAEMTSVDCEHIRIGFMFAPSASDLARAAERAGMVRAVAGVSSLLLARYRDAVAFNREHRLGLEGFRALIEVVGDSIPVAVVEHRRIVSVEQVMVNRIRRNQSEWRSVRREQRRAAAERRAMRGAA